MVDANPTSLRILVKMLSGEGYQVRLASTGARALALVSAEAPELILLDILLPDMHAFEVYRRIKAAPRRAAIPVMFITGWAESEERAKALALGAVDFIDKPFRRVELLARVRSLLELGCLRARLETEVASRAAELSLRESEARFRHIANTAPVLMWISGPDKLRSFFNKGWLEFTGHTMEHELGNGWAEGIHSEDLERYMTTYSSAFEACRSFQIEYRLRRVDGEYRWVLGNGVPRFEQGVFAGYIGYAVDITDIRQAQEERFDKGRLESLRMLTGGIAHDFGNLTHSILAAAELASAEIEEGGFPRAELKNIETVATRAIELVRELTLYSGNENGTFEPVNVSHVVQDIVALLTASIPKRAILDSDLPDGLPPVWGNPTRIRQIAMNLVINASDAVGDRGGTIRISTSRATCASVPGSDGAVRLPPGEYLRLVVSDTGCGIPEAQMGRIFDPYYTTKGKGHGLGLAVVHGIVQSHGGSINVQSAAGKGTTFEVFFPIFQKPANRTPLAMRASC